MPTRRSRTKRYPPHIDPMKLPANCNFDPRGKGRWYAKVRTGSTITTVGLGDASAKMSELHKAMESLGQDVDCLDWLWSKFRASRQFTERTKATQADWTYCAGIIAKTPSKVPGITAGRVPLSAWRPAAFQKLIDLIAELNGPSAAVHVSRYLRRLVNWSVLRELMHTSPLPDRFELPKERARRRLPAKDVVARLLQFGQERSSIPAHEKGSVSPFICPTLILARRCRLRGVEVFGLTDADMLDDGIRCTRRKGSAGNVTRWTPELAATVKAAQRRRDAIWQAKGRAVPLKPEDRPLLVTQDGTPITKSTWQSAWTRFMRAAIGAGVIKQEDRFGIHDMKRRGATDTPGTKAEKMDATGHKTRSELDKYDFELPVVDAAGD